MVFVVILKLAAGLWAGAVFSLLLLVFAALSAWNGREEEKKARAAVSGAPKPYAPSD
jgi:hypothetical protein